MMNDIAEIIPRIPSVGEYFLLVLNLIKTPREQNTTNRSHWNRLLKSSTTSNKMRNVLTLSEVHKYNISNDRCDACLYPIPILFLSYRYCVIPCYCEGFLDKNICGNLEESKQFILRVYIRIRLLLFDKALKPLINVVVILSLHG